MRTRRKDEVAFPAPMQQLLSETEVAAMLGIGVSTVWKKTNAADSDFPQPFYITERAQHRKKFGIIEWVKNLSN